MSVAGPTKQEIEAVFSRLRAQPANKSCFDCATKAPTWSSVTYGIFICIDCSAVHRNLGVHLTFVRSTNLDTNWTWLQLRQMQLGGNANAAQFFRQHNCTSTDAQQKYNSPAAQLYRDKLATMAQQAMKVHGTKLHLDNNADKLEDNDATKTGNQEMDFFAQCSNDNNKDCFFDNNNTESDAMPKLETTAKISEKLSAAPTGAPNVDLLNSVVQPTTTPSIGVRKIQPKKSGLGARKLGGLGATKVKTNFAEIEHRANLADQCKESAVVAEKPRTEEEELESVASMRLAYQDLSVQIKREEDKLKTIDPAKAKQMERLGMGFSLRGADVSHSALSDMETIKQTAAPKTISQPKPSGFDYDSFFNDYSPSMYSGSGNSTTTATKVDKLELDMLGFETIEPIESQHSNITSMFSSADNDIKAKSAENAKSSFSSYDSSYTRKPNSQNKNGNAADIDNAAQKKFGSAKGFGSDQFFGNEQVASDSSSSNLSRFQGSNSISSSDYFNDGSGQSNRSSRGYNTAVNFQAPDLDDVKESVRQGVHKVAGRLSSLANNVRDSIQDKYFL